MFSVHSFTTNIYPLRISRKAGIDICFTHPIAIHPYLMTAVPNSRHTYPFTVVRLILSIHGSSHPSTVPRSVDAHIRSVHPARCRFSALLSCTICQRLCPSLPRLVLHYQVLLRHPEPSFHFHPSAVTPHMLPAYCCTVAPIPTRDSCVTWLGIAATRGGWSSVGDISVC